MLTDSTTKEKKSYYVIVKRGKESWYLYTTEQRSYGKRIEWTSNIKHALIFSSEDAVKTFKSKYLKNVQADIHDLSQDKILNK